jgi:hypothetical protein
MRLVQTNDKAASDGYFDGRTLWLRQDLLDEHPDLLTPEVMSSFTPNQQCLVCVQKKDAHTEATASAPASSG